MRLTLFLCILGGAACGSSPEVKTEPVGPVATPTPTPTPEPKAPELPPGPCIPPAESVAAITASATDDAVSFCIVRDWPNEGGPAVTPDCWTVDLAGGALTAGGGVPSYGPGVPPFGAEFDADKRIIRVCPNGPQAVGCVDYKPSIKKNETVASADVDASGMRLAYVVENLDGQTAPHVIVEQTRPKKQLASFGFGDVNFHCGMPQFVGDNLVIAAGICAGPAAIGAIYTDKGKKVAPVGPAPSEPDAMPMDIYGHEAIQLDGDRWAFVTSTGSQVAIQDVKSGKVEKVIDIAAASGQTVEFANPGESGWTRTPGGKLVLVTGGAGLGSVFLIDPATGGARRVAAPPQCPAVTP
ncbi:MAG: hypothetical protein U1F43_16705 [Myxococcota bacterium]